MGKDFCCRNIKCASALLEICGNLHILHGALILKFVNLKFKMKNNRNVKFLF